MNVNKNSPDSVVLQECGPRFEMQPYEVCVCGLDGWMLLY